jgi:cobalt/nickel transport system permease protein
VFSVTQIPVGLVEGALAAGLIGYVAASNESVRERLGATA